MARGLEDLAHHLPVQTLVLSSLGLQVILFLCAGARRRETFSGIPVRVTLLWLAYNSGPMFVTFTLGRFSLSSATGNHPLVTLWAPFLLLHLAGPDNIAAYALQDNHSLEKLLAQVIGGGYCLYKYRNNSGHFLWLASQLMFVVGVVKYGERWLALKRANLGSIRGYLKKHPPAMNGHVHAQDVELKDEESSVRRAHSLFYICKCGMVDYSSEIKPGSRSYMGNMNHLGNWAVAEIQLSLMYDILYTKAAVIHTWHGYTIRAISPLAILTSLLLFHFSGEDMDSREVGDTAITYVLFGSALFMEWASLLNALGSSWMFTTLSNMSSPWLRDKLFCSGRWDQFRRLVLSLNSLVTCGERRWSGNMGQYNILHFCTRPNSPLTRPLLGRLAELVGLEELWNRKHFSGAVGISDHDLIKVCIKNHTKMLYDNNWINRLGTTKRLWGMTALSHRKEVNSFKPVLGDEFQEATIIWHIGTDFFLSKCKMSAGPVVDTITALSNYMMFLLVERPYMLPGIAQNKLYDRTCEALIKDVSHPPNSIFSMLKSLFRWHDGPAAGYTSRAINSKKNAENLYEKYVANQTFRCYDTVCLNYSATAAKELLEYEMIFGTTESLKFLLEVWTDMVVYAGNRCSRESHAKKLSSGGEFTSIVWLMVEHYHQALHYKHYHQASHYKRTSEEEAAINEDFITIITE